MTRLSTAAALVVFAASLWSPDAEACGCFAPPDPTVPIVQAGERILFATSNGKVTAHIQIQYAGDAKDFGWLLPLPSVPKLKLGTEELFTQLINTTQPRYFVTTKTTGNCNGGLFAPGVAFSTADSAEGRAANGGGSPLVLQASIGPYDYAVLRADNKDEMLNWLVSNHYFIPTGTEDVVGAYIHPGAYFLALKLKSGKSAGDIQPVVLEYPSELPMIPIILTSVAAQPNMGIQVWMLGEGRAIPRNYHHVVVNDSQLDWLNAASNYNDIVIRAVSEAPEKHAFVTEFAGPSVVMQNVLNAPGRFGSTTELSLQTEPARFVQYLFDHGYGTSAANNFGQPTLLPAVQQLVLAQIPFPAGLKTQTNEVGFLSNLTFYLGDYRQTHPDVFQGYALAFDPVTLAAALDEKVVKPTLEAGALFKQYGWLTRLYTTLSPQDMSKDPVFSFNKSLPEISRDHTATLNVNCGIAGNLFTSPAVLTTEQGWTINYPDGRGGAAKNPFTKAPASLRIETIAEEGEPTVTVDNVPPIGKLQGCGCSTVDPLAVGLFALAVALRRRRAN